MSEFTKYFGESTAALVNAKGEKIAGSSLAGKRIFVYFSAHWCGPCRRFTPQLAEFYKTQREKGQDFEVVFASSCRSSSEFNEYLSSMPWVAFPWRDPRIGELSMKCGVNGIPHLALFDESFNLLSNGARGFVSADPDAKFFPWTYDAIVNDETKINAADGSEISASALKSTQYVCWFASSSRCSRSRALMAPLSKLYKSLKAKGTNVEFVYASFDAVPSAYEAHRATQPWAALPMGDPRVALIASFFEVEGTPSLIVTEGATGKVIRSKGVGAFLNDQAGEKFPWPAQALEPLGLGGDFSSLPMLAYLVDNVDDIEAGDESVNVLREVAEEYYKSLEESKEEQRIEFGYGDEDNMLVESLRMSFNLTTAPSPTLLIVDVPHARYFKWSGKPGTIPTKEDFNKFVNSFLDGTIEGAVSLQ